VFENESSSVKPRTGQSNNTYDSCRSEKPGNPI
jgi:hypothetical protein